MNKNIVEATQFTVTLPNTPGALGGLTDVLRANNVNILGMTTDIHGEVAFVRFLTNAAQPSLITGYLQPQYNVMLSPAFVAELPNTPGALTEFIAPLKEAGINLWSVYASAATTLGATSVILTAADPGLVRNYFGDRIIVPNAEPVAS